MHTQTLNGPWQFRQIATADWLPASVPGNTHTDLLALGRIPEPFKADNEKRVQWVAESDWEYRRTFILDSTLAADEHVYLVADGLDTLAEIFLNEHPLGATDNMFRQYRWDIKPWLRAGENELRLIFHSPVQYVTKHWQERALPDVGDFAIRGGAYLRKSPCHFGWDWGPMLPTLGIWREIRLEGYHHARLTDVHLRQHHTAGEVSLNAAITIDSWDDTPLRVILRVRNPDSTLAAEVEAPLSPQSPAASLQALIAHPQLWWPNGFGSQPLYQVEVALQTETGVLDTRHFQIGLRTLELRQEPDAWGRSFTFVVNGVPIFAKGSNWIPADSFPTRVTPALVEQLIASAAACHQNMLRIWGGGYYEFDYFYDLCDRYGILVWQDFMFACAAYPMHELGFLQNVAVEVTQAVGRLRHRACLALWCGNNEMEQGWSQWNWSRPDTQDLKAAYLRFFHELLPAWVAAADPDTDYWPSSPSSNMPFEVSWSNAQGDTHLWEVWHGLKPFNNYQTHPSRFVSEFGFQSFPAPATIATYAEPAEWNITSYVMEHHQRHKGGNGRIITYLTDYFRMPIDFESLVYVTQLLQAEAMRVGVEYWRRNRARCSGALYWQLNDCWPVASWSSLDYYGRWKAAHYFTRRFYAPVLLSVDETADERSIVITNDSPHPWQGDVQWSLETVSGQQLLKGTESVVAAPLAATLVKAFNFADQLTFETRRQAIFIAELYQAGQRQALSLSTFVPNKHVAFVNPELQVKVEAKGDRLAITIHAHTLARFVQLVVEGADIIFSDNYFDVPAQQSVTVMGMLPAGWTLKQAQKALKVSSLWDSYAIIPT